MLVLCVHINREYWPILLTSISIYKASSMCKQRCLFVILSKLVSQNQEKGKKLYMYSKCHIKGKHYFKEMLHDKATYNWLRI